MRIKNLTEDQILTMIDGNDLKMGSGGDRGRDRDRDRDSDNKTLLEEPKDQLDVLGQTSDLYGNNILFDE